MRIGKDYYWRARQPGRLIKLYEMARTRGEAMWAVLDWAAKQEGEFSYKDLYKVFQAAGGQSTIQQFHSMVKVAKPEKDDQVKYGLSASRPFAYAHRGSKGKGDPHSLVWGLDGPLREPQKPKEPIANTDAPTGDILDKLEHVMGRPALKAAMARWKMMSDPHRIAADIQATVPARYRMQALQAVWSMRGNKDTEQERDQAEVEVQGAEEPEAPKTPFNAPKAKAKLPAAAPVQSDDDDDEDMGDGWETVPNGTSGDLTAQEPDEEPEYDDMELDPGIDAFDEPSEKDADDVKDREYPVYLPDPDDEGDMYEEAMFRIVAETDPTIDEFDPIWEQLKNSKDQDDAREIIRKSRIPKHLQPSAVRVAKAIYDNTGRDWEGGSKKREGLLRIYR